MKTQDQYFRESQKLFNETLNEIVSVMKSENKFTENELKKMAYSKKCYSNAVKFYYENMYK